MESIFLIEYVVISFLLAMPYALILTYFVKIKPFVLSLLSVALFVSIYAVWITSEGYGRDIFDTISVTTMLVVYVALFISVFFTAHWRQSNA